MNDYGLPSPSDSAAAFVAALRLQGISPVRGPHRLSSGDVGVTVSLADAEEAMSAVRQSPGAVMDTGTDGNTTFSWHGISDFGADAQASRFDDGRLVAGAAVVVVTVLGEALRRWKNAA